MKFVIRLVIAVVAALLVAVLAATGVGTTLPVAHRASRMALYHATPDSIYALLTNASAFPKWRTGITRVENLQTADSSWSYREHGASGDILYTVDVAIPSSKLVTRIADKSLPFGGSWTYELTPSAQGAWLRITENGEVYNPLYRFLSHYVLSQHATIDTYLHDLARKLGQTIEIDD